LLKTAIGLMSGTSMDGIDLALLKSDGKALLEFGPTLAIDYPPDIRRRIEQGLVEATEIEQREQRPGTLFQLEQDLTNLHATAVSRFMSINRLKSADIDLLGFHGQTVLHRPTQALTVQLGDGPALAEQTGIDVVHDMRAADMTAGGQGAPLVPVFHRALAGRLDCEGPICFVNIGGISNITYVDGDTLIAFDCGPGNALIDQWVQTKAGIPYDQGGHIASEGGVVRSIVDRYLKAPFFDLPGPKSLDRGDFPPLDPTVADLSDGARSLAQVTAGGIYRSVDHLPKKPRIWIICGGGRLNSVIVRDLQQLTVADGAEIRISDEIGLQGDMLEAQAFAYLAVRSINGLPLSFPATTGCRQATSGGLLARSA
jgi:anhydro-N-acetylmuramic acid kinase